MLNYGICKLSQVPVRSEPSDKSEMVTQLLFGETFEILEIKESWANIKIWYDNYQGWIDFRQCEQIDDKLFNAINENSNIFSFDQIANAVNSIGQLVILTGSPLPFYLNGTLQINRHKYNYSGITSSVILEKNFNIQDVAMQYLNAPYLWGGRSPLGIDCSGFTQQVFRFFGIRLPRDAHQQAEGGIHIKDINSTQPGDLAFFADHNEKIIHTGIIIRGNKIIHSSGQVRIDNLETKGIYNKELGLFTHHLRTIKRYF